MKKTLFFIFGLGILCFPLVSSAEGYNLGKALESLGLVGDNAVRPQHLVGIGETDTAATGEVTDVTRYLQRLINGVTALAATLAVLFLVMNAWTLIIAAGGDDVAKAKKGIIWALVGLLVIIGAYVVVKSAISFTYSGEGVETVETGK